MLAQSDASGDVGSDDEQVSLATSASKGKGKRNDTVEEQRKEQNRRAQREFRQRKQQYIKELEAKVALQDTSRDEQLELMRKAIQSLVDENVKLRELLAGVSGFIGQGLGGYLPKLGVEFPEFQNMIKQTKSEAVSTLLDKFVPQHKDVLGRHMGTSSSTPTQSNSMAAPVSTSKRRRTTETESPRDQQSGTASPANGHTAGYNLALPPPPASVAPASNPAQPRSLPSLSNTSAAYTYPPGTSGSSISGPSSTTSSGLSALNAAAQAQLNEQRTSEVRKVLHPESGPIKIHDVAKQLSYEQRLQDMFNQPTDNPKLQAMQLISYHMRNKREQPNYVLPPSLKATVTQQTVPHSHLFDGIIFPSLRDRLILLKDQYDLQTLLEDLLDALDIHDNDLLIPANWELGEKFLRKYWYVIDAEVLSHTNRWRKQRGEVELTMKSIVPDGTTSKGS